MAESPRLLLLIWGFSLLDHDRDLGLYRFGVSVRHLLILNQRRLWAIAQNLPFKRSRRLLKTFFLPATMVFSGGCASTSVLIPADDSTFAQAQQRLERTMALVEETKAPLAERVLFVQAEGFYLYRYKPPTRSTGAYLAEAAASITDFPAFQSLAGSLNLLDLRLRAPDSAIQLWETLLTRCPQTTLRPLALYRLGWAYRNASAEGWLRWSHRA